jgi:hypothetical protein
MENQPQQHDDGEGDLLVGAEAIAAYLAFLGWEGADADKVYNIVRRQRQRGESGKPRDGPSKPSTSWPIGSDGAKLIASKRRLNKHAQKITAPAS